MENELCVEWVNIESLHLNPSNPRINDGAIQHVAASLKRFGWRQPIVCKRSGEIVAGNTRYKAARTLAMEKVPVVWFDGSDLDALGYAIADNRTAEFATWNEPDLATLLEHLRDEDTLEGIGFSSAEVDELLRQVRDDPATINDPGPQEPPADPITKPGDLWLLGEHRLLCGDSTKPEDVARVMNGQTASLLATDPPYLVNYDGANHPAEHHRKAGRKPGPGIELGNKHWDQYVDPETSLDFYVSFLKAALPHVRIDAPVYQWHASKRQMLVEQAWTDCGLLVHQSIQWVKARGVLTYSHFLWRSEPCFYGWQQGHQPEKDRRPPADQSNVWEVDQVGESDGIHPTQKPRALFSGPIQWHTRRGEIVLEPFCGSGTEVVAAEELGRRCYALEISPAFCDAVIERWQRATGKKAVRVAHDQVSVAESSPVE